MDNHASNTAAAKLQFGAAVTPHNTAFLDELNRSARALEAFRFINPRLATTIRALQRTARLIARPLRVAVIGEFNSGKSTLANLLAGIDSLPTAAVSNTRIPTIIRFADIPEVVAVEGNGARHNLTADTDLTQFRLRHVEIGLPITNLRNTQFIDAATALDRGSTTSVAVLYSHHPDIVIWCTAANQAWKATELETWTALPPRLRKHGLLVATHADLLPSDAARATVRERLQHEAGPYFSGIVMIGKPRRTSIASASAASDQWQSDAKAELFKTLAAHLSGIAEFRLARARRMVARLTSRALDQL